MAFIFEINELIKVTKTNPKAIQNQLKNNGRMDCNDIPVQIRLQKW